MRCPYCGAKNKKSRDYCKNCGSRLPKPYEWDADPVALQDVTPSRVASYGYEDPVIEELAAEEQDPYLGTPASTVWEAADGPELSTEDMQAAYAAGYAAALAAAKSEVKKAKKKARRAEEELAELEDELGDTELVTFEEAEDDEADGAEVQAAAPVVEAAAPVAVAAPVAEAAASAAASSDPLAGIGAVAAGTAAVAAAEVGAEAATQPAVEAQPAPAPEPEPVPAERPAGASAAPSEVQASSTQDSEASAKDAKASKKAKPAKTTKPKKKRSVGRIVLTVVLLLVLAAAIAVAVLGRGITSDVILSDFSESVSDIYPTIGLYDNEGAFEAGEVSILSVRPAGEGESSLPEFLQGLLDRVRNVVGFEGEERVATVQAVASNGSVEVAGTYEATFKKQDGQWGAVTDYTPQDVSYRALTGPSDAKIVANISTVLSQGRSADGQSLDLLYSGYAASVVGHSLDVRGDADQVTVRMSRDGAIIAAEADVLVNFVLANGSWQIDGISAGTASDGLDYQRLIGTWTGMYVDDVTYSAHCYAGRVQPLTVTISGVDNATGTAYGTFSGVAHDHDGLQADSDWTEGDNVVYDIPFEAQLIVNGEFNPEQTAMQSPVVGLQYDVQDMTGRWIRLVVGFGTATDPNACIASLTTYYTLPDYPDYYIPFTDRYLLSRAG